MVERLGFDRNNVWRLLPNGDYVRFSDYEEVRDERDQGVRFVEGWQERAKELEDEMARLKTSNFLHCQLANAEKPSEVAALLSEALKADGDGG